VTELNSRSVPFINYKIGDMGRVLDSGCKCNRPYEAMEILEGRVDDFITCPDGRVVYDAILAYVLKDYASQFKAYQDEIDMMNIHFIPKGSYHSVNEQKIRSKLRKYLGNEMKINFTVVDNIPPEKSGKLRYFVSRVM
jgi:phenylacetate-CoA ligase